MLRRLLSLVLVAWVLGFVVFAVTLPRAAGDERTDAVVVLTGGEGRIAHGLDILARHRAGLMLVSGVDPEVKPNEFVAGYHVPAAMMACCITLGFDSVDTRSNASETAQWVAQNKIRSIRLVTSDWHMRRSAWEVRRAIPPEVTILEDAVPTRPSFNILLAEYSKYLARLAWHLGAAS
jgi:uncharacterized SAM-binding protein YcdF (DUF218 family)